MSIRAGKGRDWPELVVMGLLGTCIVLAFAAMLTAVLTVISIIVVGVS